MDLKINGSVIRFIQSDITTVNADAIVNAANPSLLGGMGVDGAIHRVGGPSILEECRRIVATMGQCRPGEAVITGAGHLPARRVIHTVGPIWHGGAAGEAGILASAYRRSLALAVEHDLHTVAFPSISTGAYGYPVREAAVIAIRTTADVLRSGGPVREVIFVLYDRKTFQAYEETAVAFEREISSEQARPGSGRPMLDKLRREFRRCEEAIHAAETLLEENLYAESISRAYYAVIHAVMFYLAEGGKETRNPEEAESLFTSAFVAGRKLEPDLHTLFETIRRAKKAYPHNYLYTYSGEDARDIIRQAQRFLDVTREHFKLAI